MIFQAALLERVIAFAISQVWPFIYFPYFIYKILKRGRNRSTITLSSFFLLYDLVLVIALLSIIFIATPFSKILYVVSFTIYIFSKGLLILVSWMLTQVTKRTHYGKIIVFISFYLLLSSYVIILGIFYDWISYGSNTGWRPEFSWSFLWMTYFYVVIFLIIPETILTRKVFKEFKGLPFEKRIKLFIGGIFLDFIAILLLVFYNTWVTNLLYRSIHLFIAVPLTLVEAYLLYQGFGRKLKPRN